MMYYILRVVFHLLVIRPFMYVYIGLNVTGRENLPSKGPAIIVCNHNSHLDTFALLSLLPVRFLGKVRPVAAADYFMKNRFLKWYSTKVLRIIPVVRGMGTHDKDPLEECHTALEKGHVLVIYPEGSRGDSEDLSEFKKGIAHLAQAHPDVSVYPVCIRGLGTVLPKGTRFPLPYFCDIVVGKPRYGSDDREAFLSTLYSDIASYADQLDQ